MEVGMRYILNSNRRNESLAGAIDTSSVKYKQLAQDKEAW
jgi:hypothetical protein